MSALPNDDENDATSEQFTDLLLSYLARRADQAQRRSRAHNNNNRNEEEGAEDDDDESPESADTENEENAWGTFFGSKNKKKSSPKLDLIEIEVKVGMDSAESLGRLSQWIGDIERDNIHSYIERRDYGGKRGEYAYVASNALASEYEYNPCERYQGPSRVFCSSFSRDGNVLCCASQDHVIHLIDSSSGYNREAWPVYKQVESQFSGWSIIDVALSPDHEWVAYSGWSSSFFLVNTYGHNELHESYDLNISSFNSWGRCCVFGIEFDPASKKVICALSGGCLILHDLEKKRNEFSLPSAHDDDINQATFLDPNVIVSGSDDAILRVWDIRCAKHCIGGFVGHYQGITCVSTPNDYGTSQYVLSNSKDQSMKLWDLRNMNTLSELSETRLSLQPSTGSFDYRYRGWNPLSSCTHKKKFRIDKSIMTYRGHSVSRTLCRSGFSPVHSTNAKYVYCGSSDCSIYIYNTLNATLHKKLGGNDVHSDIVRDVCWHPYLPIIVSASWDGSVVRWTYNTNGNDNDNEQLMPKPVSLDMPQHLRRRDDY